MFVDPLAEETFEPYLYTGNNQIMFTDPTGMSKEGGENRYEGVWNHCEEKYDYTLINDDGGNLVDTIEYKGVAMDGKTLDYPVYQDVERYSKPASSEPRVKELARRPGYQKISINKFNGHAIEPVSINGTLSDLIVDYVSEITGSRNLGISLSIVSGNPKKALGILSSGSKGEKLATKLLKYGDNGNLPVPHINNDQFKKAGGELIHKETGTIYRSSNTRHRGKEGEYKIWPAETKDFGKTSKTGGSRTTTTTDHLGNVIGH